MRNPNMMHFLAGVLRQARTGQTLMTATGLDALELQVAVSAAQESGFIAPTGKLHPALILTATAHAYAAAQLAPFADLIAASTPETKGASV